LFKLKRYDDKLIIIIAYIFLIYKFKEFIYITDKWSFICKITASYFYFLSL